MAARLVWFRIKKIKSANKTIDDFERTLPITIHVPASFLTTLSFDQIGLSKFDFGRRKQFAYVIHV